MNTAVRDVMTTRVVAVRQDASFKEIATALRENRVSAFPVLDDDGKVIGVVSEADLLTQRALDVQGVVAVRDRLSNRPPKFSDSPLLARSSFPLD